MSDQCLGVGGEKNIAKTLISVQGRSFYIYKSNDRRSVSITKDVKVLTLQRRETMINP